MSYIKAFLAGGIICAIGQILIDKTKLTPARILVAYVIAGIILHAVGLYEPFAEWAGAGATVPIIGFGNLLANGVKTSVSEHGLIGAFIGGVKAAAAGITASIFFGYLTALVSNPGDKS